MIENFVKKLQGVIHNDIDHLQPKMWRLTVPACSSQLQWKMASEEEFMKHYSIETAAMKRYEDIVTTTTFVEHPNISTTNSRPSIIGKPMVAEISF